MKPNVRNLARKAFKKRYGYHRVKISPDGQIWAYYDPQDGIKGIAVGHVRDCYMTKSESGAIRLSHKGQLVYLFETATEATAE